MAGLQPPARSWFRLASIARMEAAEAAAAASTGRSTTTPTTPPLPRIPIPRPQQQPTSPPPPPPPPPPQQPPTPPTQPPPSPPSPPSPRPSPAPQAEPQPELPFTPTPQQEIKTQIATEAAPPTPPSPYEPQQPQQMPYQSQQPPTPPRSATPPESPKAIKPSFSSPPPSPTVKQTNNTHYPEPEPEPEPETKPPPPPLYQTFSALPEEKTITNSNGSRANNVSYSKLQGPPTKEEKKLRVITMAGENTGAIMDIGSAAPHRLGHHFHKADGNGHGRKMEQEHEDSKKGGKGAAKTKHMEAVVNSNVQGINNSIVLNSTTTQHSPGVHITFASNRKPKGSGSSSSYKAHHSDQLH